MAHNENLFKIKCDQSKTEDYINLENKLKNVNIDIIINKNDISSIDIHDAKDLKLANLIIKNKIEK